MKSRESSLWVLFGKRWPHVFNELPLRNSPQCTIETSSCDKIPFARFIGMMLMTRADDYSAVRVARPVGDMTSGEKLRVAHNY